MYFITDSMHACTFWRETYNQFSRGKFEQQLINKIPLFLEGNSNFGGTLLSVIATTLREDCNKVISGGREVATCVPTV